MRYFAKLTGQGKSSDVPLGEIVVRTGQTTQADFTIGSAKARIQITEADGAFAEGHLSLARGGWRASCPVDASGLAAFEHLLLNDPLRVTFHRPAGKTAFGQQAFGPAIELGTVRATGDATPIVFRLPAR